MATKNINTELFKRYAPTKKIEIVKDLTENELLSVNTQTITRIVKDAGTSRKKRSRDKNLYISRGNRCGNGWNSTLNEVYIMKGKLWVDLYIQMDSTDTNIRERYETFFGNSDYTGKAYELNRHEDKVYHYCTYDRHDKAGCMRSILLEYIQTKYRDKLNSDK